MSGVGTWTWSGTGIYGWMWEAGAAKGVVFPSGTNVTPPEAVTNLAASAGSPATTSVLLNWTATGDGGASGFTSKYIIKRLTAPITAGNFDAATTVFNSLTSKASGQPESFTVSKLNPNTHYYFAIKVMDEVPNKSAISNVVDITTTNLLPTVTGITPASGDNGEARTLTFTGTNYTDSGTTVVWLVSGDNVLTLTGVSITNGTHLTSVVPEGVPTGLIGPENEHNGTSDLSMAMYTITPTLNPLPVVTNVIPQMAASNTAVNGVQIFGNNFTGTTAVHFNSIAASNITVVNDTEITVDVAGLPAGEYDVKVTTSNGTNESSTIKFVVTDPVIIDPNTEDMTTSGVIDLGNTNVIPVQITMTTDDSNTADRNTDTDTTINVVIPPYTVVTDSDGNAYTGDINSPRVVKSDTTVNTVPGDAVVIEMGNPDQTINFNQYLAVVISITFPSTPEIYYYNKDTGKYELAGKAGTKDGIVYVPGGTLSPGGHHLYDRSTA